MTRVREAFSSSFELYLGRSRRLKHVWARGYAENSREMAWMVNERRRKGEGRGEGQEEGQGEGIKEPRNQGINQGEGRKEKKVCEGRKDGKEDL